MNPFSRIQFYELLLSIALVLPVCLLLARWIKKRLLKGREE